MSTIHEKTLIDDTDKTFCTFFCVALGTEQFFEDLPSVPLLTGAW